ncbi:DMT family transporter [Paraglaciecola aquimarina]|uniref:DMT family transporter n=1 Tax=Paraglaciecola aquimarina TaxID=1235557 RepID=A0ABU3SS87_9ALTE|nr:DMT family transporter [Paraglaciecola aquimarina]MDU0352837.1 DMT family transporter [Paraglaciecola aquimarina]
MNHLQIFSYSLIALFAFAANSVLCRLALAVEQVDAVSFTAIRLLSAAAVLIILIAIKKPTTFNGMRRYIHYGSRAGAIYLLVYAAGFSFAYLTVSTATGALALFASVQFTMLFKGWLAGHRLNPYELTGILLSLIGFVYFVFPELEKPSLEGCILMIAAGIAWGFYSLIGAKSTQPLEDTLGNFLRLVPISLLGLVVIYLFSDWQISLAGLAYTLGSGILASGLGYSLWYHVLPKLKPSIAAVSQLSVPIWAAFGGVLFVNEGIGLHLAISSGLILGDLPCLSQSFSCPSRKIVTTFAQQYQSVLTGYFCC